MSKEKKLLMRWLSGEANEMTTHLPLLIETQNLLAEPEQEQEVYAKGYAEAMRQQVYEAYESGRKSALSKPLSDEEIFEIGYKAGFAIDSIERDLSLDYGFLDEYGDVDNEPYFKLVRAIEKAHGVGVDDV